jgi:hypothetical protein
MDHLRFGVMRIRHLLIKAFTPLIWRISERRKLAALQEFSDTELDSGWQSLYALERVEDPKAKAELFQHSLEEFYHADVFSRLLSSYANAPQNRPAFARTAILPGGNEREAMLEFLVQVYVGETEINQDFAVYSRTGVDEPIREVFARIKKDEEGHEEVSWDLMLRYAEGDSARLRWLILRKRFAHAWQRYVNFTQAVGNLMLWINLTAIYLFVGGFFFLTLRNRLGLDRDSQLEILRLQLQSHRDWQGRS